MHIHKHLCSVRTHFYTHFCAHVYRHEQTCLYTCLQTCLYTTYAYVDTHVYTQLTCCERDGNNKCFPEGFNRRRLTIHSALRYDYAEAACISKILWLACQHRIHTGLGFGIYVRTYTCRRACIHAPCTHVCMHACITANRTCPNTARCARGVRV